MNIYESLLRFFIVSNFLNSNLQIFNLFLYFFTYKNLLIINIANFIYVKYRY